VRLTDTPVKEGSGGWRVFDDGRYVSLGKLNGNKEAGITPCPGDVDPSTFTSVSIWRDRFDVPFADVIREGYV
jgi:hypothetical protein